MPKSKTPPATPEQINDFVDSLVAAYNLVREILKLPHVGPRDFGDGVQFSGFDVAIRHEYRPAFTLGVRIELVHGGSALSSKPTAEPRVNVTWASGGGTVSEALAQASLQLEVTQRVAQAAVVLAGAWRLVERADAELAVCKELGRRQVAAWEAFRAAVQHGRDIAATMADTTEAT